jgi:hypothetical protein
MANASRELIILTNGAQITIAKCELTPLELSTMFTVLLDSIKSGQFPLPNGLPSLNFNSASEQVGPQLSQSNVTPISSS